MEGEVFLEAGVVTVETMSNHTVIIHCINYTRAHKSFFVAKQTFFPSLSLPLLEYPCPVMCWVSEVEAAGCT